MNLETWMFGIPMFAYLFGFFFIIALPLSWILNMISAFLFEDHEPASLLELVPGTFFIAMGASAWFTWVVDIP